MKQPELDHSAATPVAAATPEGHPEGFSWRANAVTCAALVALWLAMLALHGGPLDAAVLNVLHVDRPWLAWIALRATRLGGWHVLVAAAFVVAPVLAMRGRIAAAVAVPATLFLGRLAVSAQKVDLGEARPDKHFWWVKVHSASFPSSHAAISMFFYLFLALLLTRMGTRHRWVIGAALAVVGAIGVSRVMLGVHWPSDVIAGWSFGMLWALAWSLALCFVRRPNLLPLQRSSKS